MVQGEYLDAAVYCGVVSRDEGAIAERDVQDSEAISDSRKRPTHD
jgi:hypothetical protein